MTTPTTTPAGWYPDPGGRHEFRYWDGASWSPQVSDGGLTATDAQLRPAVSPEAAPTAGPSPAPAPAVAAPAALVAAPASAMPPAAARAAGRRWLVPVVAAIAVLAVLAGLVVWGVATRGPSAAGLYQQMRTSAAAAKSVHIKGAFTQNGQKLQIDVAGDRAGTNSRVTVDDGNGAVEILTVNGRFYLKADAAYWTKNASAAAAKLAAGKYVVVPAGSAAGTDSLQVGTLLDQILAKDMSAVQKLNTNVDKTQVSGVPAFLITDKIGSNGSKIYVSADGRGRLLRMESPTDQGLLDFTQWDAVAPVGPPPGDQMVKLPGL